MTESGSWFGFDDLFWLTLLVIFLSALISSIVPLFRTNRCLKLFDEFHITYINEKGEIRWGDVRTSSHGIELAYDEPFTSSRGILKTSTLVFEDELEKCIALCRTVHSLPQDEYNKRQGQIRTTFNPPLIHRMYRFLRNVFDMLQDAISKSVGVAAGRVSGNLGTALSKQKSEVSDIGETLTGVFGNSYEPLLERLVGKPVIVQCATAPGASEPVTEFAGYLVEYTDKYLALFDIDQQASEKLELEISGTQAGAGYKIELQEEILSVVCTGPDALILKSVQQDGVSKPLNISLIPGCEYKTATKKDHPVTLVFERTYQLDLILPRSKARVRYGSAISAADNFTGRH